MGAGPPLDDGAGHGSPGGLGEPGKLFERALAVPGLVQPDQHGALRRAARDPKRPSPGRLRPPRVKTPAEFAALGRPGRADRSPPLPQGAGCWDPEPIADPLDRLCDPLVGGGQRDANIAAPTRSVPDARGDHDARVLEEVRGEPHGVEP